MTTADHSESSRPPDRGERSRFLQQTVKRLIQQCQSDYITAVDVQQFQTVSEATVKVQKTLTHHELLGLRAVNSQHDQSGRVHIIRVNITINYFSYCWCSCRMGDRSHSGSPERSRSWCVWSGKQHSQNQNSHQHFHGSCTKKELQL